MMTLDDLLCHYENNPKRFSNCYNSGKKYNTDFYITTNILLSYYYFIFGESNFSEIFYFIKHGPIENICKKCKNKTPFKNFKKGYCIYCSKQCAVHDGSRISSEGKIIAAYKRKQKMTELLNDPVKGKEYREKISKKSKERMSSAYEKQKKSNQLKKLIEEGKFTPNISNSWTHWKIEIEGKKFRSSFEGLFYLYHVHYKRNNNMFYEKLRIPFMFNNCNKIYIVDFIDDINNMVFEIKPESLIDDEKNICKQTHLIKWCDENGYYYNLITEKELKQYLIEMSSFSHPFIQKFKEKYKWI